MLATLKSAANLGLAYLLVGALIGVFLWKTWEVFMAPATEIARQEPAQRDPGPAPRSPVTSQQLAEVLRRQNPRMGYAGLYVRAVGQPVEAAVEPDRVFPAASLYKLPILAEVVRQSRSRQINLDQEIVVEPRHRAPGAGVLQSRVGDRVRLREVVRLMIAESDNTAAMMALDTVGLERVNASMRSMGLTNTRLLDYRVPGAMNPPGPYMTTARDMGLLLSRIADGELVDREGSDYAMKLLESPQAQNWLGDGLPWYARVAHKWGDLPEARHDAGIITTPSSGWVIVVMTDNASPETSDDFIRAVSRDVFQLFEGPDRRGPAPATR